MREKRTIYLAYGSNLNISQMTWRYPDAKPLGATILQDYKLTFWGGCGHAVATIIPCEGSFVPVALWSITPTDEHALDEYEGYPHLYRKEYLWLKWGGRKVNAMVYIMNHGNVNRPSRSYFTTILNGYRDFAIDPEPLFRALRETQGKPSQP